MTTSKCRVWDLEPGDEYIVRADSCLRSRFVLGILQRTPMNGALLEVRTDCGSVIRSHLAGEVDRVNRMQV